MAAAEEALKLALNDGEANGLSLVIGSLKTLMVIWLTHGHISPHYKSVMAHSGRSSKVRLPNMTPRFHPTLEPRYGQKNGNHQQRRKKTGKTVKTN
jgi:hypothetical protein